MPRRAALLATLSLIGACSRVSADVSGSPVTAPAASASASVEPIPDECDSDELRICAGSCNDSECLAWCAGSSCAAAIASLWGCMDEAERSFAAAHPMPQMEFEFVTDEHGDPYEYPTSESLDRQYDWQDAYAAAIDRRWTDTCEADCAARLARAPDHRFDFCLDWRASYYSWTQLSRPPVDLGERSEMSEMRPTTLASMVGALTTGTDARLGGELARIRGDSHVTALARMISQVGWQLSDADRCVPNLDPNGREFVIVVALDPRGAVLDARDPNDPSAEAECVASQVATTLALPIRVAREHPLLEILIHVRPKPDFGFGLGGLDSLQGISPLDDWNGWDSYYDLAIDDVGNDRGSGSGGIGGIGGMGTIGGGPGHLGD